MSTLSAPCELLCLRKEDFDNVLKATIKKQWDEIQEALAKFTYFKDWDDVAKRECCLLSKIKKFEPNQVILGDGIGQSSTLMIYFIIEGKCKVIEHLWISEEIKSGIKYYTLFDPPVKNSIESFSAEIQKDQEELLRSEDRRTPRVSVDTVDVALSDENVTKNVSNEVDISQKSTSTQKDFTSRTSTNAESVYEGDEEQLFREMKGMSDQRKKVKRVVSSIKDFIPPNVKLRYMQVCILGETSSFRDGVLMKNRRIIAITPVKCLLIPSYWLMQHNKGNVWDRIRKYLMLRVPSRETVFRAYVQNKKWIEYKRKLRTDILASRKFPNNTTIHDVPYSIRVESEVDS